MTGVVIVVRFRSGIPMMKKEKELMKSIEKQPWVQPTVTEFDIAEHTLSGPGDGPDGAFGDPEGGGGNGGGNGGAPGS